MDLASIAQATNAVTGVIGQALILVSPQEPSGITAQFNPNNIPITSDTRSFRNSRTFLFHYEGENTATLQTDITDHYVEDNTSLQDHIAIKPTIITTHGYIGELNDVTPPLLQPLKLIADALKPLAAYTPEITATALIKYNQALLAFEIAQQVANTAAAVIDTITGQGVQNKQQRAFTLFYNYFNSRQLFTVNTPWGQFKDMAISVLRAVQDEETRMASSFEITFKQMRFARNLQIRILKNGRLQQQSSDVVKVGSSALNKNLPFDPTAIA